MVSQSRHFVNQFETFLTNGLISLASGSYPPINLAKIDDDLEITVAVAGFTKNELTVEFDGQNVTITGQKTRSESKDKREWTHQEIAYRDFCRKVAVYGKYTAQKPTLENGILTIFLVSDKNKQTLDIQ